MANPYEGWYIIWGPDSASAYLVGPDGTYYGQWFRDSPELNTFDPISTAQTLGQDVPRGFRPGERPGAPSGGQPSGGISTNDVFDLFSAGWDATDIFGAFGGSLEDLFRLQRDWSEFMLGLQESGQRSQEDAWAREQEEYEKRRDEERAYSEALYAERLAEQLARQLTAQHGSQEEAWARAVMNAPSYGANILQARIPGSGTLPESVGQALFSRGRGMGAGFSMPWPGGTALGEAQITPSGQDWMSYIMERGFPGYVLR